MTRRDLLRRARQWCDETLAFDGAIRPIGKSFRVWVRHLARLRKRDPVLWQAVYDTMFQDQDRDRRMGYEWWKAQLPKRWRRLQRIRKAGRQAYLRKWSSPKRSAAVL